MFIASPNPTTEYNALVDAGASGKAISDLQKSFLVGAGYSGALPDMIKAYLEATHSVNWHEAMKGLRNGSLSFSSTGTSFDIAISATDADLTDNVFPIDLANAPASFWTSVQHDGGNIRMYSGETALPVAVVHVDTTQEIGGITTKVPSILSASGATLRLVCLSDPSTQPAVTDPLGRDAVMSGYDAMWVGGGNNVDFTGSGTWTVPSFNNVVQHMESLGTLDTFARQYHQGAAYDEVEDEWIGVDTLLIERLDASLVVQASNASLNSQVAIANGLASDALPHLGAGCVVGDYFILPVGNYPTETLNYLTIIDKTTLAYVGSINTSTEATKMGSVCWNGSEQRLVAIEWDDGTGTSNLYKYTLTGTTLAYDTSVALDSPMKEAQGIEYFSNGYYITNGDVERLVRIESDGSGSVTTGVAYLTALNIEGVTRYKDTVVVTIGTNPSYLVQYRPYHIDYALGGGIFKTGFSPYISKAVTSATGSFSVGITFNSSIEQKHTMVSFLDSNGVASNNRTSLLVETSGGVERLLAWEGNSGISWVPTVFGDAAELTVDTSYRAWLCYDHAASTTTLYLNGVQTNQRTSTVIDASDYDFIYLGKDDVDNNEVLDGFLADFIFKDGVVTADEIKFEFDSLNNSVSGAYTFV